MAVLLLALPLLVGCAESGRSTAAVQPDWSGAIERQRQQQRLLDEHVQSLERRVIDLEQRLGEQATNHELLASELSASRTALVAAEMRIANLERSNRPARRTAARTADSPSSQASATEQKESSAAEKAATVSDNKEKESFTVAYLAMKSGDYAGAVGQFEQLLVLYPAGSYLDQTLYWLGECYYARSDLERAGRAFAALVDNHPNSGKHAAAMLRLGESLRDNGQPAEARAMLQRLLREHPQSASAEQGRRDLARLTTEP